MPPLSESSWGTGDEIPAATLTDRVAANREHSRIEGTAFLVGRSEWDINFGVDLAITIINLGCKKRECFKNFN